MTENIKEQVQVWTKHYKIMLGRYGYNFELAKKEIKDDAFTLPLWLAYYRLKMAKRGLFLYGKTGTGKTFHCEMIKKFFNLTFTEEAKLKQLCRFGRNDFEKYLRISHGYGVHDMMIDEFGGENEVVSFGERINVAVETVNIRYKVYTSLGGLTIFTCNWDEENIIEKFGDRVISRLREMCTFVLIDDSDLRGSEDIQKTMEDRRACPHE